MLGLVERNAIQMTKKVAQIQNKGAKMPHAQIT